MVDQAESAFLDFARVVLEKMRDWATTSGMPQYHDVRVVFSDQGTREEVSEHPFFMKLIAQNDPGYDWMRSTSRDCIQSHLAQGLIKPPPVGDEKGNVIADPKIDQLTGTLWYTMFAPINDVLEKSDALELPPEDLEKTYQLHRALWSTTSSRMICTIPLVNFQGESEFQISKLLRLAPFSYEEKTRHFARIGGLRNSAISFDEFRQSHFKLIGTFYNDENEGAGFGKLFQETSILLSAMRLLKSGIVGAAILWYQQDYPLPLPTGATVLSDFRVPGLQMIPYRLSDKEMPSLQMLFLDLLEHSQSAFKKLGVAFRRFNQSYGGASADDRIIDLTIAMESCLLAGQEPADEISYKFSLRGSALLREHKDPIETYHFLRYVYALRSWIVHKGKSLFDSEKKFEPPKFNGCDVLKRDVCPLYEDLVRLTLRQYMSHLQTEGAIEKINKNLDLLAISSLGSLRGEVHSDSNA